MKYADFPDYELSLKAVMSSDSRDIANAQQRAENLYEDLKRMKDPHKFCYRAVTYARIALAAYITYARKFENPEKIGYTRPQARRAHDEMYFMANRSAKAASTAMKTSALTRRSEGLDDEEAVLIGEARGQTDTEEACIMLRHTLAVVRDPRANTIVKADFDDETRITHEAVKKVKDIRAENERIAQMKSSGSKVDPMKLPKVRNRDVMGRSSRDSRHIPGRDRDPMRKYDHGIDSDTYSNN